jgi:hypothetical protein
MASEKKYCHHNKAASVPTNNEIPNPPLYLFTGDNIALPGASIWIEETVAGIIDPKKPVSYIVKHEKMSSSMNHVNA